MKNIFLVNTNYHIPHSTYVSKNRTLIILILLTIIGAVMRFYNLNWGAPFYFHPDERNIASSVTQLQFPKQMNPHFFAYGSFPIYIIYFSSVLVNYVAHVVSHSTNAITQVSFENAIVISRFFSAVLSTLLIPFLFLIGKNIHDEKTGIIAAFFAVTSVGFLQYAHFGTFEMWLTFFSVLLFWCCIELLKTNKLPILIISGVILGLLLSIKVVALVLLLFPLIAIIIYTVKHHRNYLHTGKHIIFRSVLIYLIAGLIYCITCPYTFFDWTSFQGSMQYESSVGIGSLPVFYTQEFYYKIPVYFQVIHVFPFLTNPLVEILFFPAILFVTVIAIRKKTKPLLFVVAFFLVLLFSQGLLFVKWTRYMVPTLPFYYLIIAVWISHLLDKKIKKNIVGLLYVLFVICFIFSLSYEITALSSDTREQAVLFAKQHIHGNPEIISEVYDLGITPFNPYYSSITLYNFYDIDTTANFNKQTFSDFIHSAQYIILPSQRVIKTRLANKKEFPNGYTFYSKLINGSLGFTKIYETPCGVFCKITYLGDPVNNFEETANVFDRPTVFIFQNTR